MPKNATAGALNINRDLSAVASWAFAPSDTTVRLSKIPSPISQGSLPADPEDGDEYEVIDADGSCNAQHIVVIAPAAGSGQTISGLPGFALIGAFSGVKFKYDAAAENWDAALNATGVFFGGANFAGTNAGTVTPGDFAGGAAINLCAFRFPIKATGQFRLQFTLQFDLSAADTVIATVQTGNNCTAVSGGGQVGGVLPSFNFETGAGPGGPVVVTSAAPVTASAWQEHYTAAGTYTLSFTIDVQAPTPAPATPDVAIIVQIATAAATMHNMQLSTTCSEISV